ncbi:MAG: ammonium transporter [Chloroflexaceae bacterium]|nr:ammonium transporter [Chloroflexaceae bacterium]
MIEDHVPVVEPHNRKWWLLIAVLAVGTMMLWWWVFGQVLVEAPPPDPARSDPAIDTVWVLVSAFLIFFMQAGFAFLETGMVRKKNTANILTKNYLDFGVSTIAFFVLGFGLMYGDSLLAGQFSGQVFSWLGIGGIDLQGMLLNSRGEPMIPMAAFWLFQLVFAGTAATIVSGAMAERTQIVGYVIYSFAIAGVIYPLFGHWAWNSQGWLHVLGFHDFAGSTVVHSLGGWMALVGTWMIGDRWTTEAPRETTIGDHAIRLQPVPERRFGKDRRPIPIEGQSLPFVVLGVFILWLGWFGFNAGSTLGASGEHVQMIALIAVNTTIAASMGGIAALLTTVLRSYRSRVYGLFGPFQGRVLRLDKGAMQQRELDIVAMLNGTVGGLVAITASCAYVHPYAAFVIGGMGGVLVVVFTRLLEMLRIDDAVGAIPAHLVCGVWGTLALGLFASENGVTGLIMGNPNQLLAQLIGVLICAGWTVSTSFVLFYALNRLRLLRVSKHAELHGLGFDIQHIHVEKQSIVY